MQLNYLPTYQVRNCGVLLSSSCRLVVEQQWQTKPPPSPTQSRIPYPVERTKHDRHALGTLVVVLQSDRANKERLVPELHWPRTRP